MMIGKAFKLTLLLSGLILIQGCSHTSSQYSNPYAKTNNQTANRTAIKIAKYQSLQNTPWNHISTNQTITIDQYNQNINEIRRRLIVLGDLSKSKSRNSNYYDRNVQQAIIQFQWRHGLKQTGNIDIKTIRALNITPTEKIELLNASHAKWAQYDDSNGNEYILVNVPDYTLRVMKNGRTQLTLKVIAGTVKNQTPEINSMVSTIVFNPTWNVPESIISKEIAGFMMDDNNYLSKNNIDIFSNWNGEITKVDPENLDWMNIQNNGTSLRFTQSSGDHNALGKVKFLFKNSHDVYLHDTQSKRLFNTQVRAYSHGCIRVEEPLMLAQYLLDNYKDQSVDAHEETTIFTKTKYVNLSRKIPIHITYITAWVDQYGYTHYRDNIYRKNIWE